MAAATMRRGAASCISARSGFRLHALFPGAGSTQLRSAAVQWSAAVFGGGKAPLLKSAGISGSRAWASRTSVMTDSLLPAWLQHVQPQVRGLADSAERWDKEPVAGEAEAEPEDSRGFPRGGGGAGGIAPVSNPLHPHGLNVTVVNGNVDVAMRKLRRKVIAEGVKKKFQNNRFHVTPTEKNKFARDVGIRRMERRQMRAKLRHVWAKMKSLQIDQ